MGSGAAERRVQRDDLAARAVVLAASALVTVVTLLGGSPGGAPRERALLALLPFLAGSLLQAFSSGGPLLGPALLLSLLFSLAAALLAGAGWPGVFLFYTGGVRAALRTEGRWLWVVAGVSPALYVVAAALSPSLPAAANAGNALFNVVMMSALFWLMRRLRESAIQACLAVEEGERQAALVEEERAREKLVLGILAHDVLGPVGAARALLESAAVVEGGPPGDELGLVWRAARRQLERAERVARDLLDVLRGRELALPEPEAVEPGEVVWAAAEGFRSLMDEKEIVLEVSQGLPRVVAPRRELERVFFNLLSNALRFSPQGGRVRLRGEVEDGHLLLHLDDEGPGIPEAKRKEVLEPFTKLEPRDPGAGLGLAVCKQLLEGMGGSIRVGRSPEGGARLTISLPLAGSRLGCPPEAGGSPSSPVASQG